MRPRFIFLPNRLLLYQRRKTPSCQPRSFACRRSGLRTWTWTTTALTPRRRQRTIPRHLWKMRYLPIRLLFSSRHERLVFDRRVRRPWWWVLLRLSLSRANLKPHKTPARTQPQTAICLSAFCFLAVFGVQVACVEGGRLVHYTSLHLGDDSLTYAQTLWVLVGVCVYVCVCVFDTKRITSALPV